MDYGNALTPKESHFIEWLVGQDVQRRRIMIGSSTHKPKDVLADEGGIYEVLFSRWKARVKGGVFLETGKPRPNFT